MNDALESALQVVDAAQRAMDVAALAGIGENLFIYLAIITMSWLGLVIMMSGGEIGGVMAKLIQTLFKIGFVYWMVGSGFELIFVQGVDGSLAKVAQTLGAGNPSQLGDQLYAPVLATSAAVANMFKDAGMLDVLTIIGKNLSTLIVLGVSILIALGAMLAYFVFLAMSVFLVKLALILGPIFIPWLLISQTDFLFYSWLKFLIIGALYKVVGAVILGFAGKVLAGGGSLLAATKGEMPQALYAALAMAGLELIILYLVVQIPQISASLISGGGGAGSGFFGAIRQAIPSVPNKPPQK